MSRSFLTTGSIILAVALVALLLAAPAITDQVARAKTRSYFAWIYAACAHELNNNRVLAADTNLIRMLNEHMPNVNVPSRDSNALDGWKNPISVNITQDNGKFLIVLVSSGPDGVPGGSDDVTGTQELTLKND